MLTGPERDRCSGCGRPLTKDEKALTRKLVNRGASEFFCLTCLSRHFEVSEEQLKERIDYFRRSGCTLFE